MQELPFDNQDKRRVFPVFLGLYVLNNRMNSLILVEFFSFEVRQVVSLVKFFVALHSKNLIINIAQFFGWLPCRISLGLLYLRYRDRALLRYHRGKLRKNSQMRLMLGWFLGARRHLIRAEIQATRGLDSKPKVAKSFKEIRSQ